MDIINHWNKKEVDLDLISYMQEKIETLPHFLEFKDDASIEADMRRFLAFKRFKDILVFGIGGSSLGGQTLYQFRSSDSLKLHFVDNIDPKTFNEKLYHLNPETTGVYAISKSGNTAETLMQTLLAKQYFEQELGQDWASHFWVLTENKESALRQFATLYNIPTFDHNRNIGGRFCIFTNVGATIATLCGFDFIKFREGARDLLLKPLDQLLEGACHLFELNEKQNVNQSVMLVYSDTVYFFAKWYAQLFGESLGKKRDATRKGLTPVFALGAVDQHSQLQLYLDGPRDKLISFVTVKGHEVTTKVKPIEIDHPALNALYNKTMDQLYFAEQQGTKDTLKHNGCHLREFNLDLASPYELGQLMMFHIIETIALAHLLKIDPFDQPAVEDGKLRALSYLSQ
ncbi:MAG: Glucose-6-phosphate isomerase [Holosporales bacterium]